MKFLSVLSCLLLFGVVPSAWGGCTFDSGNDTSRFMLQLPSHLMLNVTEDGPIGGELWSSGWQPAGLVNIGCNSIGNVSGQLAHGIGAAVPGHTSNGFDSVFETNIPGIGISVFWCNTRTCNPDYTKVTPVPALAWRISPSKYILRNQWWVRIVRTGRIPVAGRVRIGGETSVKYQDLTVATLTIGGHIDINTLGCRINPDSLGMTVPLPTVAKTQFSDATTVLPDNEMARTFEIRMRCNPGVRVTYRIDGTRDLLAGGHVLANAQGEGHAVGIGIQLFRGGTGSTVVQPLGTKLLHTTTGGFVDQDVAIPLTARYYKTVPVVATIRPGTVSAAAVFTLTYE